MAFSLHSYHPRRRVRVPWHERRDGCSRASPVAKLNFWSASDEEDATELNQTAATTKAVRRPKAVVNEETISKLAIELSQSQSKCSDLKILASDRLVTCT